jgi:hypothetical protein
VAAPVGTSGHIEIAPAITLQTPPDVNLRRAAARSDCPADRAHVPRPRRHPVGGGARIGPLSVVGELSAYASNWRSSNAAEGQEINHVARRSAA